MSRGKPRTRQLPRIAAARWLLADPRDVAFIEGVPSPRRVNVASVSVGLARWQRTIGRRRVAALLRRVLIVAVASACILQLVALAAGTSGPGAWLLPAVVVALLALLPGLSRRTSAAVAARMLDRDLRIGAEVSTAYELERDPDALRGVSLAGLALADGRDAIARSLGGARARLLPRHRESGLLVALVALLAVLLVLPAPGGGSAVQGAAPAGGTSAAHHVAPGAHRTETDQPAGPDLSGYGEPDQTAPGLTGVQAAQSRGGGVASKTNPYGGGTGTSNHSPAGSVQPSSRTVGNAGYLQKAATNSSATSRSTGESSANAKSTLTTHSSPAAASISDTPGGKTKSTAIANGQAGAGRTATPGTPGQVSGKNGGSRGGGGTAGQSSSQSSSARGGTPGGATAGGVRGSSAAANGVVPQLGSSGKSLPIQPGYEAVKGTSGNQDQGQSTTANGGGGASHSGQATGTAAGKIPSVAYVPPGSAAVAPAERRLLIGYFGSFARVSSAGW
jgi:hypothetical protein